MSLHALFVVVLTLQGLLLIAIREKLLSILMTRSIPFIFPRGLRKHVELILFLM
jgi:hypothetical protein